MVYRIYVEKKPGFDGEAKDLCRELKELLGITRLQNLRLVNRYDVEGIDEALFEKAVPTVFSEPPVDVTYNALPAALEKAYAASESIRFDGLHKRHDIGARALAAMQN